MDDEDGRCLLDVICDPEALNDFLHGSETHLDTDDLLDGSADPSSSFFSSAGGHVPEVQPPSQLSASVPVEVPSGRLDLDFLEDDDILAGTPTGGANSGGIGTNHEPCDILQQSLAEANITEQSLQEAEAELDLGPFGLPGLTQVVQTLPDPTLSGAGGTVGVGLGVGGTAQIFPGPSAASTATPPNTAQDMIGPVLAHPGLQLQPQGMNKAISVQPFMQQVGLGNVTLQPISGLQALPNGSQSGHLGIGQIQVVGQPTVMAINQSGQPILAKTIGGYQLQQPGPETGAACTQAGLGGPVLSSAGGGGLLIQGSKTTLGSPALNGASVSMSSASTSNSGGGSTMSSSGGLVSFGSTPLGTGTGIAAQQKTLAQGPLVSSVPRTPTPIQPKPPQGGVVQTKLYKAQQQQSQLPTPHSLQSDGGKGLAVQQGQVPVSAAQNVAFLAGKPSTNVVLSTQPMPQGTPFPQTLFKPQAPHSGGKPLSVHLSGSIVIPSQTVLQGQNQFLLPHLQAGGQILTQHPGGHIITSQGPGGQLIANQILTANQNLNLGQVLTSQGHSGTAHILSGHIQLQPGQMGHPTLFQMPVSLAQTQAQATHGTGHPQTVIQGMPIQNSLAMLGQVEGLSPAVSLQPSPQQLVGGIPSSSGVAAASATQCQPGESITVLGSTADQAAHPVLPPSILTVQTAPSISVSVPSSTLSSSPSSTSSASSNAPGAAPAPPQVQHSPGKLLVTSQGSSMILSHESLQMFLQQEQQQHTETASPPLGSVPASVIVSSCAAPATSGHDGLSAEAWPGQGSGSASPLGPANKPALVYQLPSTGQQQQPKVLGASPSHPLASHTAPSSHVKMDSPQPTQPSPLILGPQIQSPHHPQQSRPPSRSCTPSSLPPLFIIHNQLSDSPPPQTAQPQVQAQLQGPGCPPSQPAPFQAEAPPSSCSPNPPQQALPLPFQFAAPLANAPLGPGAKQQVPLQCLTAEQQQTLQLVGAQLQTLSTVAQPSLQQKHLINRLHQVQQSIILKQQGQPPVSSQFSPQQDVPAAQIVTSAGASAPAQLASLLQPSSVLVKAPVTAPTELKVLSAAPVAAGTPVKQAVAPTGLPQPEQLKPGLISSVGGMGGLQIQVLASGLSQMTTPQAPAAVQSQTASMKMPFSMQPSKEARMLEQLRRQQGSALHPNYSSPFTSFGDAFHKLIPYHLYQGTPSSPEDNHRVDGEFESVSSQLLKRTQAMLDKYRLLLFEESKRLGPSAEMVMIDRMFIMEEKSALNQDRVLAKERPDEYIALQNAATAGQCPLPAESSTAKAALSVAGPTATPAPVPALVTPTKLVIKQGGSGASVSWSTSTVPAATTPSPSLSSIPASSHSDDDDALPQRSKKPPIKTYEARRRIGLKLKIKQEAGLSKVVHNTALDPVHAPARPQADPQPPRLTVPATANRTALPTCTMDPSPAASAATSCTFRYAGASTTPSPSLSSSSSSAQVNGTVEHHGAGGAQRNPVAPPAPVPTTCRLPLRKTYRENVSPPLRPTVPSAPLSPSPHRQGPPSPLSRTVIASVKVENQSGRGHARPRANTGGGEHGTGGGGGIGSINVQREQGSPPGLMQELAEVEEVFNRGIIKNRHHLHRSTGEEREGGAGAVRPRGGGGKSRERSSRAGHPSPGPPSPAGSSGSWDSFFPAKRHKSDSPDMDNASFSSGSPPPDDSLNEHLQSAIDSILNLQQGPTPASSGSTGRGQAANPSHQPLLQCPPAPSAPSYRPMPSSGSPSVPQRSQPGGRSGEFSSSRGQNGKLVSRTYRR